MALSNLSHVSGALRLMVILEVEVLRNIFPETISGRIERSVYNSRRRGLAGELNNIRLKLASHFNGFEDCFVIDGMLWEVCRLLLSSRSRIYREDAHAFLDRGYCAAQAVIKWFSYWCSVKKLRSRMTLFFQ